VEEKKVPNLGGILQSHKNDLLNDWLAQIQILPDMSDLDAKEKKLLHLQAMELLQVLTEAMQADPSHDITAPAYAEVIAILQDFSVRRAEQGFAPSATASIVLALKTVLAGVIRKEMKEPGKVLSMIDALHSLVDQLALLTFDSFVKTREVVIEEQSRSLMELSIPVLRIWEKIMLLPLVGMIDTDRAMQLMESLLEAIVGTESLVAILDVTGVPVIDTKVAQHLIKTIAAAKMLGAQVIITGISPNAAQTLTSLEINLSDVRTCGTLRAGFQEALAMIGYAASRKSESQK